VDLPADGDLAHLRAHQRDEAADPIEPVIAVLQRLEARPTPDCGLPFASLKGKLLADCGLLVSAGRFTTVPFWESRRGGGRGGGCLNTHACILSYSGPRNPED